MSAAKVFGTIAFLGACAAGGYGYWLQHKYEASEDTARTQRADLNKAAEDLAACTRDRETDRAESEKVATNLKASQGELDSLRTERAETEKRLEAFRTLTSKFQKMIDSGKLQVTMRHGRMVVKLPAEILFASGSADISKGGQSALTEVAAVLKQLPDRRFMVAGHTDNVPVTPPSAFRNNLQLSTARAETVTEVLIGAGMNPAHLSASGYSEYEPVRENTSEAGRRENRRIEIILLPNLAELPVPPELGHPAAAPAPAASASGAAPPGPSALK
ncbi:MAG TPA: OmpA family protein [Polyangiaceae bacterium]